LSAERRPSVAGQVVVPAKVAVSSGIVGSTKSAVHVRVWAGCGGTSCERVRVGLFLRVHVVQHGE
jgi:hypothetical protein